MLVWMLFCAPVYATGADHSPTETVEMIADDNNRVPKMEPPPSRQVEAARRGLARDGVEQ